MCGVDSRCEGSGIGTGSNQVSLGRLGFGWGVDAGIRCCIVPTIFICLDESCVMRIAMLMFQSKDCFIDEGMFICDQGENVIDEGNMWPVDLQNCRTSCFEGDSNHTMTHKGGVDGD